MDHDLRAPLLSRGTKIAAAVTIAGLVIIFVVLPRYLAWSDARDLRERNEAEAPYRQQQQTLERMLAVRFEPVLKITGGGTTCPAGVTGPLPLVQREWLTYALTRDAYPTAPPLSSPAFLYWANAWTPSGTEGLAKKSDAEQQLVTAKYVALFTTASASAIEHTGEATFEGGGIAGELSIIDLATYQAACSTPIRVQPSVVVAVKQDSAEGDRWALQSAERDAIADAFWTGVQAELARIAPGAQVVKAR
ncbi:MAG TPA: hypothetical protein VLT45_14335 [Kofleriaceae bacterium]|nr:hypothetical protein [Kofleriaceae bacterium]